MLTAWLLSPASRSKPVDRAGAAHDEAPLGSMSSEVEALRAIGAANKSDLPSNLGVYRDQGDGGSGRAARTTARRESERYKVDLGDPVLAGRERLSFVYVDFHGVVTEREVTRWTEYDEYIQGYCKAAGAMRTFRKDRIEEWLDGTDRFVIYP